MVCGRCGHGVYKTFMSVCHMRMYTCKHPDEKLTLVSRQPCAQSAPYMSGEDMRPRGHVSHPDDEDEVLRYIMCRDKGLLGIISQKLQNNKAELMVDTRCQFEKEVNKTEKTPLEDYEDSTY